MIHFHFNKIELANFTLGVFELFDEDGNPSGKGIDIASKCYEMILDLKLKKTI